ncbi:MAG: VanZ family protein [Myxococcales bacterium]|nr:VanZ family protein [Myxococcales bacterium]
MFERAPREPEWVSWLWVALWSGFVFALVPLARALEAIVEGRLGRVAFLYAVFAALALAGGLAVRQLWRAGGVPAGQALALAIVGAFYAAYIWQLRDSPVEALHFVQYGVLGILAFRALSQRIPDPSVYVGAALVGGAVGILDEAIQWATPQRVWDLRDMGFNFIGAGAIQVGIAAGIQPAHISPRLTPRGLRRICAIAGGCVLLLTLSLLNTPPRIAAYTQAVSGLSFLAERPDVMIEYGHRYEDPEVGVFRSRYSPADLARVDAERGHEAGGTLAVFPGDAAAFLAEYTAIRDPFLHEMRVHLFRRDRYLETAESRREGSGKWRSLRKVAARENLILERYFPVTLQHSGAKLGEAERRRLAEDAQPGTPYESRVSEGLITRFREVHVIVGAASSMLLLWVLARAGGRRLAARDGA